MKTACHNSTIIKDNLGNKYCEYCLKHNPKPIKAKEWTLYIIFVLLLLGIYSFSEAPNIKNVLKFSKITDTCDIQLSDSSIFDEMLKQDVLFPEYALKSAIYETGHFTSNICVSGNNILGITYVKSKYQIGYIKGTEGLLFGKYASIKDCIKHYKQIQLNYSKNIDNKYSDNKNYTKTLKTF